MNQGNPIVVEQAFSSPKEEVWKALTDQALMPRWFFEEITEFRAEPGFETRFPVEVEERTYWHLWKIVEALPGVKLVLDWRYGDIPGDSTVVWQLEPDGQGTKLTLTHSGHESFPQDNPIFSREACQGGWEYFINERLKSLLESGL